MIFQEDISHPMQNKQKVAIIGAGVSGLTCAHFLKEQYDVTVFEKDSCAGGLIKCRRINGCLFHTCGGHVFNSKRMDVLDWFWSIFNQGKEFTKTDRNSCVFMDDGSAAGTIIPYPIENHVYLFDEQTQKAFYDDLDEIDREKGNNSQLSDYKNFGEFLRWRFGKTLYDLYFEPYNKKIWRQDLTTVPLKWMDGKLPMPTTQEMRDANANKIEERSFVHSSFWYEKMNGSQYIADTLAEGLHIVYGVAITQIKRVKHGQGQSWLVNGKQFDKVVFCGNIKDLVKIVEGIDIKNWKQPVAQLKYHGTTAVFCEIDSNPYSWIYLPSRKHESHRIICTGNFAQSNNGASVEQGRTTATIEFTDKISKDDILDNLRRIPLRPKYLSHEYNKYSYPIQDISTRGMIKELKTLLAQNDLYFTGRFADWEYYNMDAAMGSAMDLCKKRF